MAEITHLIHVIGISLITSNEEAFKQNTISKLWDKFFKTPIKEMLDTLSSNIYAVYSEYENGDKGRYRITIGYAVNSAKHIPEGLTGVMIPLGTYKIYKSKNNPEDIIGTWKNIWNADPRTLSRKFLVDFEEYNHTDMKIYIGVTNEEK